MDKKVKYILITVTVIILAFVGAPVLSANIWKSRTLTKANATADTINKTSTAIEDFDTKQDATSADFDTLIAAYKDERNAIQTAKDQTKSIGGFKGLDITGDYKKASETSSKLVAIYDELLNFNTAETASAEAEKQIIVAFEQSGSADDANGLQAQAQNIRKASSNYQQYLNSGQASDVERRFLATITKLADSLENTAQAINTNNLAQINAADGQLQAVLKELEALEPEQAAQTAANLQKIQAITDRLNTTLKELE